MPPKPRTTHEITVEKSQIIDQSVELIHKRGLNNFSIRALSRKIGMSPANIYNYFHNKDELYIYVRIRGFLLLQDITQKAVNAAKGPREKLEAYCREYISFCIKYPGYYQLMMNTTDPKALDFIGTPLEKIANVEKESSIKGLYFLQQLLGSCMPGHENQLYLCAIQIICQLHGVVSLDHSHILREMGVTTEQISEIIIQSILKEFVTI